MKFPQNLLIFALIITCLYISLKRNQFPNIIWVKGPLSVLRQFLTSGNPLKMMKNDFYFMLKALFVLDIFTFLSWVFYYVEKWIYRKAPANIRLDEDVLKTNIFSLIIRLHKTSSRRLQDVLVKTNIFLLSIRLQDVFKTSCHNVFKTFSRHLQDVFKKSCKNVFKTSSRRGGRGGSSCNGVLILPKLSH